MHLAHSRTGLPLESRLGPPIKVIFA